MTQLVLLLGLLLRALAGATVAHQTDAKLPDLRYLSRQQKLNEFRRLRRIQRQRARRWACDRPDCNGMPHAGWLHLHARAKQRPPSWGWTVWLIMTGRGWGKTRTAAETVKDWAKVPNQFIAVVARTETLVREICFEHRKSGLLTVIDPAEVVYYHSSPGNVEILLKNGTVIRGFGAEVPDNLRGWEFDKAWCDEYAAWKRQTAQDVWDMLWFCLREARLPQVIVTTTPKPLAHIIKLVRRNKAQVTKLAEDAAAGLPVPEGPRVVMTAGHTYENRANLSEIAIDEYEDTYSGTRLGDQELGGLLLEDVEGSLWKRFMFEWTDFRLTRGDVPTIQRMVVAVDPATTTTETADETGFAVMGRSGWRDQTYNDQRPRGYLFHSGKKKLTPMQTMRHAARLYHLWQADAVILEANNGGEYLATVLQMVAPEVNYRIVHATRDKRARATPVAGLYEQERMHHVGPPAEFDQIETLMTTYVGAPEKDEKSPDELDAVVWAATDLFLDPENVLPAPEERRRGRDSGPSSRRRR